MSAARPWRTRISAWRIIHYPPGTAECREYVVKGHTLLGAKRKLAEAIGVPLWSLR